MTQRPDLLLCFPRLAGSGYQITSPADKGYNCIAWAAGITDQWWEPDSPDGFWPPTAPNTPTVDAVIAAYGTIGYQPCQTAAFESGFEKIAVYADLAGNPKHAARQLPSGKWTSKLGKDVDIEHDDPNALNGATYGSPVHYLRRRVQRQSLIER